MNNIFKNAYFGKPYKTKSGNKALYIGVDDYSPIHLLFVDDWFSMYDYNSEGFALDTDSNPMPECDLNIVSEWQEEVDEDKLDKILDEAEKMRDSAIGRKETGGWYWRNWAEWGYRKALEK